MLKLLDSDFRTFGGQFGIPLCCIIWFWNVNNELRSTLPEYNETMCKLTNNQGVILCPTCLIGKLEDHK